LRSWLKQYLSLKSLEQDVDTELVLWKF
jgi:hypothetical protein